MIESKPLHSGKDSAGFKILPAEDLDGLRRLSPILAGLQVSYVQTLTYAKSKLDDGNFDLIVTGVHFDDSSAVDFLKAVREHERHKETPFVFIRTRSSSIAKMIQENIAGLSAGIIVSAACLLPAHL